MEINKILKYLILIFSFSIPLIGFNIPKYVLGALILVKILSLFKKQSKFLGYIILNKKTIFLLTLYFLYITVTLFYSDNTKQALQTIQKLSYFLIFPLLLSGLETEKYFTIRKVLNLFLFGVLFLEATNIFLILIEYFAALYLDNRTTIDVNIFFYQNLSERVKLHPGYYSLMVFIAFWINFYNPNSKIKNVIALIQVIFLMLLATRIIIFTFLLCFLFVLVKQLKKQLKRVIATLIVVIILLASFGKTNLKNQFRLNNFNNSKQIITTEIEAGLEIKTKKISNDLIARVYQIKCSLQAILENKQSFFYGYGAGDYKNVLEQKYKLSNFEWGLQQEFNSHNQYLTTMLMGGLIGLIFFILYILTPLFLGVIHEKLFYYKILTLFLIYALTESYLLREAGVLILSFFISLVTILNMAKQKN